MIEAVAAPRPASLMRRRGDYGFDAPIVPILLGAAGLALLVLGALGASVWSSSAFPVWALLSLIVGLFVLASAAIYHYTARSRKFAVWATILRGLELRANERVLDMGSGRGAVLLMAAKLLPQGRAFGIDL